MNEPEGKKREAVFALYGKAMYLAQSIEYSVIRLLIGGRSPKPALVMKQRFEYFFDENIDVNFRRLKNNLSPVVQLKGETETMLKEALKKRNWLAHEYWWDRLTSLETPGGIENLAQELEEIIRLFEKLDRSFKEILPA